MTTRFDPSQLDTAWDAMVLPGSFTRAVGDTIDQELLELLATTNRPAPRLTFVRSLERELALPTQPTKPVVASSTTSVARRPVSRATPHGSWRRPSSRWMTVGYALAAIALVLALSTGAISRQRFLHDTDHAIPAVSDWSGAGPPTSDGIEVTTSFSHVYSVDELAEYGFGLWHIGQLTTGSVAAGDHISPIEVDLIHATVKTHSGFNVFSATKGTFLAEVNAPAWIWHAGGPASPVAAAGANAPATVSIENGDVLILDSDTLLDLWNSSATPSDFIAGALYSFPDYPVIFHSSVTHTSEMRAELPFDPASLAGSVEIGLEAISIAPGQRYAYTIGEQSLLLAEVSGDGLVQEGWSNGIRTGEPVSLSAGTQALQKEGPGYYTLTNTGTDPVSVSLFRVEASGAPNQTATPVPSSPATVESFSSRTFDQTELAQLQSNDWGWVGISRKTVAPGQESHTPTGSPAAESSGATGLTMIAVEDGPLAASVDAGAWVERGSEATTEQFDQQTTVTLNAGDTLFAPPISVQSIWNPGQTDVTYLEGTVYTTIDDGLTASNPNAHEAQGSAIVNGNLLATGAPLTMTLEQVVIDPGTTYSYAISAETWLMALVDADGLQLQKQVGGVAQGDPEAVAEGARSLHEDGFGDYTLTNVSANPVSVSFYRVEPATQSASDASPATHIDMLFDQTLSVDQLQGYRLGEWRSVSFARNRILPQGDTGATTELAPIGPNQIPGLNVMVIESGELAMMPDSDVLVARGPGGELQTAPGGTEIHLSAGDAVLYSSGTKGRFWNPTTTDTIVIGGGGYLRPSTPIFAGVNGNRTTNRPLAGQFLQHATITPGAMPSDAPVAITIEEISIPSGGSATLATDPSHLAMAVVMQGDLVQTALTEGKPSGTPVPVELHESLFQSNETQTVKLRNVGSSDALVYVIRIEPAGSQANDPAGTASPPTD